MFNENSFRFCWQNRGYKMGQEVKSKRSLENIRGKLTLLVTCYINIITYTYLYSCKPHYINKLKIYSKSIKARQGHLSLTRTS